MNEIITHAQIHAAAEAVQSRTRHRPTISLVLGSGLSALADEIQNADVIPYQDIPHWPICTVAGHGGRVVLGELAGKSVLAQQGRSHYYEGYSMSQITLPIRVMNLLGIKTLIVTNAAGGINRSYAPGDLMLIEDHLNMLGLAGHNPLRGPNDDSIGPRFPDMTSPYDAELRQLTRQVADQMGLSLQRGVYAYVAGPSFETPAELRYLQVIGADAVGMSTVPSVIVARHAGIRTIGISTITNKAILDPATDTIVSHEEVLETGNRVVPQLSALVRGLLQRI
jgi:purine-nucleoside phosphorylase